MDKSQLLKHISSLAHERKVSREELLEAFATGLSGGEDHALKQHLNISETLYYIGATIVLIGIAIFVEQHWDSLSSAIRIASTLGSGIAAYVIGVLFHRRTSVAGISQAFFLLSVLLLPLGLSITFHEAGWDVGLASVQSIIFAMLFLTYLSSFFTFRRTIFLGFAILFATLFFFTFTNYLFDGWTADASWRLYNYRLLFTGLSYLSFGHYFKNTRLEVLASPLYALGALAVLLSALFLGGWKDDLANYSPFWQLVYPVMVFAFIFLSVRLKVRSFLTSGALFLMIYILKMTMEHFPESLGWSLALIMAGLLLIVTGFVAFEINKRYLRA